MSASSPWRRAEIVAAMGAEPTDEQWTAISMPLEPYVLSPAPARARPP